MDLGHSVTEAHSGAYALKLLEAEPPFDVVVTDYAMPGMNGHDLAVRIQQINPGLPVILATGYAELPSQSARISTGCRSRTRRRNWRQPWMQP